MNFCRVFHELIFGDYPQIRVIADRCERTTIKMLAESGLPYTVTDKGNAGSLMLTLELALEECADDEPFYVCEDDYLHLDKAPDLIVEGVRRAEYVTLYDHPDKYTRDYDGGEISKVIKTASSHWRYTASTCMTFASKPKILKEDLAIWKEFTEGDHPHDHFIFQKLAKEKRRRLAVCIPGAACHTDLTYSGRMHHMLVEPWAIEMMAVQREEEIWENLGNWAPEKAASFLQMKEAMLTERKGWERLIALDALHKQSLIGPI
jgi:hypothetical protein